MWWSHADAATYRAWIEQAGLAVVAQELVPEGDGAHALFWARRPPDPPPGEPTSSPPRARPGCAGRHGQDGAMNGTADAGE